MTSIISGSAYRSLAFGPRVTRNAATLPQTATQDIFTVSGGAVLVTSLLGQVTTVIAASDPVLSIGTKPTTGSAKTSGIATTEVLTSKEVGTWIGPSDSSVVSGTPDVYTLGKLMVGSGAGDIIPVSKPFVVAAGTITITTTASKTGALKWYLTYVPLDDGASVAAA